MLAGMAFSYPCMLSQCPTNVINALTNRHLSKPLNSCTVRLLNPFLTVYKKHAQNVAFGKWPMLMNGEWRIGKRECKLMQIDRSHLYDLPAPTKSKAFAKREVNVAVPSKARLIQGNHNELTAYEHPDEYAVMNAVMKSLEGHEFDHCGVKCRFAYAGGLNHDQLSDMFTSEAELPGYTVYDERDGKNWDATMNEALLRAESFVYDMLKLRSAHCFLTRCARVVGKILTKTAHGERVVLKYLTAWKRLSGDWNTSVGNTIISMIIVFTVISMLPPHLRPQRWFALFMGDDYLGVLKYPAPPCLHDLHSALNFSESRCGITPVRGLFLDPLRVSFISLGVWPRLDGGYQFVPHPGKQLAKLFWAKDVTHRSRIVAYAHAIAISFWDTYQGFEVMQNFLKAHYTHGSKAVALDKYIVEPLTSTGRRVNWREGFVYKYRIPFSALAFEFPSEKTVWHHPVVEHMIRHESLDPPERFGVVGSTGAAV